MFPYNMRGGDMLNSGGYGCVFYPSLKCKNNKTLKNKISKLMTTSNANSEMDLITNMKQIVINIPNYQKHFITDIEICEPASLDKRELEYFSDCEIFEGINKSNI
jgi:hypothetical protein